MIERKLGTIKENNNSLSCASCGVLNTWRNLRNTYFRAVFRRQDSEEDERAVSPVENLLAFAPEKLFKYQDYIDKATKQEY